MQFIRNLIEPVFARLAKWVSSIRRPPTLINDDHVRDLRSKLVNGDVIASALKYELSNVFMPGFYSHVGIYLDGVVYEVVTSGVRISTLENFCFKKDGLALLRLQGPDWTPEQIKTMKDFCDRQVGEPYDFRFE